jgi:hypothetical protein
VIKIDDENLKPTGKEVATLEALIQMEWEVITSLNKKLKDPDLTVAEWTQTAKTLGYHMSILNKMLNQRGETSQFTEQNLGDFIKDIEPRIQRQVRHDFRTWTRHLLYRR